MMKTALLIYVILFNLSAFAQRNIGGYPDPIPGLLTVSDFCTQMEDGDDLSRCLQVSSQANYFSANVLGICAQQTWDEDKVDCVAALVDRVVENAEVQVCEQQSFADDKLECLMNVMRMYPYKTYWKVDREPGATRAAQFCGQFFFDRDKNQCIQITSSARLYSAYAVDFCQQFFTDKEKINCMAEARDRALLSNEAQACGKVFTDRAKMTCLQSVNRKWRIR